MRNMMSQSIKRATVGNLSALVEDYEFNDGKNPWRKISNFQENKANIIESQEQMISSYREIKQEARTTDI